MSLEVGSTVACRVLFIKGGRACRGDYFCISLANTRMIILSHECKLIAITMKF